MMDNNNFWLRKIAAFLHDPPDKAFWHEFRDVDALRFWFWITNLTDAPFYFLKTSPVKKVKAWQRNCLVDKWNEIVEAISNDSYGVGKFKKVMCDKPDGTTNPFPPEILANYFRRKFHNVASSQIRIHLFGFERLGPDVTKVNLLHSLDESSWIDVIEIAKEFREEFDRESRRNKIAREVASLANIEDEFRRFLTLWRKRHWISAISPADTRIPDHPVIDLETMESAIAATLEKETDENGNETYKPRPSFLILEFGPIQKFIANSRKTRDLWFSSWLISYLAWKAMKPIVEELGPDNIVYPDLYKQPLVDDWLEKEGVLTKEQWKKESLRLPTLPNTFFAIVPEGKEKDFAIKANQAINNAWGEIVNDVYNLLMNEDVLKKGSLLEEEFKRQTRDFPFDIYWLGLKWGNGPEKAVEDYKKLMESDKCWEFERLWKKMKTRVNNPNIGDTYAMLVEMAQMGLKAMKYRGKLKVINEPGHKCSLCGERTVLTNGDPNDIKEIKTLWKKMADAFPGHIKANEYLCAVCLVKRLAPKVISQEPEKFFESQEINFDYHYPSTGSIAIAPFIFKAIKAKELGLPEVQWSKIEHKINEIKHKQRQNGNTFLEKYILHGRTVSKIQDILENNLKFLKNFEPEWLYPETPYREVVEPERYERKQKFTPLAQSLEKTIRTVFEEFAKNTPMPKYYAAVYLDGDNLGKWLKGDFAPKIKDILHPDFVEAVYENEDTKRDFEEIKDIKRPVTPAIHRAISGALRDFALEVVPYVVEENLGIVVYTGGDDPLFLMPLENLFKTLITLRKLYSGEQFVGEFSGRKFESDKGFIKIYEKDKNGKNDDWKLKEIIRVMGTKATLSAGVAIAHYLDPLDITLEKAKEALKEAKNKGRNRVGFRTLLRSGSEREAVVPWDFVEVMERFRAEVTGGFSSRFLRALYQEIDVFQEITDAFDAEFFKFGTRGQGAKAKLLLCDLIDARKCNTLNPREFLEALLIADFVVREEGGK